MEEKKVITYVQNVLENMPSWWLSMTTHRLDIYNEGKAKAEFLEEFETLYKNNNFSTEALNSLPTAYDYIRLGHPLSCILEWAIAKHHSISATNVISFSSKTVPVLAVLRKNVLLNKKTLVTYTESLPPTFDADLIKNNYGYNFELKEVANAENIESFEGSTIYLSNEKSISQLELSSKVDFYVNCYQELGSILIANNNDSYVSEIQHVRRRETISMTPSDSFTALKALVNDTLIETEREQKDISQNKKKVISSIQSIAAVDSKALIGSSGLSIQYAIMMGMIHQANELYKGKDIKIIVPPNCYGGTNDQARRVAACLEHVEVVDLLVDGDNDMVQSINTVLNGIAKEDAVPFIIAEIPTNPRVEVPDLEELKAALSAERKTADGTVAIDPVFILDQTFCPNVHFLGEGEILSTIKAISYASGSKFPSGGKCTAGYVIGNANTAALMDKIELHLSLCDNEATALQYEILAKQLPSMVQRIADAYQNTREFVTYIQETLPSAKINFVSEELASQGFTPSVFSLDLPTTGSTAEEKETRKRELNHRLINKMITQIPNDSKYCVSYGQLKGCYWTIPATSTQGTTKEGDKDYIARVALSPNLDLELHKKVFKEFVDSI